MIAVVLPFILISIIVFSIASMVFYKYYISPSDSSSFVLLLFTILNTLSYFCFLSLALNSYSNIFHNEQSEEVFKKIHISEKLLIIGIYSHLVLSVFVFVPFTYFYTEEVMTENYNGYSENKNSKIFSSIKYTVRKKININQQ